MVMIGNILYGRIYATNVMEAGLVKGTDLITNAYNMGREV
jgi:hypothetical protein